MKDNRSSPDEVAGQLARDTSSAVHSRSVAEWLTLGLSIAIVASMLGLLSWLEFTGPDEPPRILTHPALDQVRLEEGGFYLPVVIENAGDQTVEALAIEATLDTGDGEPQVAQIDVAFLAGGEHIQGAFVFESDPREGELSIRPLSYQNP